MTLGPGSCLYLILVCLSFRLSAFSLIIDKVPALPTYSSFIARQNFILSECGI